MPVAWGSTATGTDVAWAEASPYGERRGSKGTGSTVEPGFRGPFVRGRVAAHERGIDVGCPDPGLARKSSPGSSQAGAGQMATPAKRLSRNPSTNGV